jgi:hypothetical protein
VPKSDTIVKSFKGIGVYGYSSSYTEFPVIIKSSEMEFGCGMPDRD